MHVLALLAAEEDSGGSGAAGLVQIGILLLIPLAMYFLMIRPQRRRMREQQAMQAELEVGDEVMTAAGIYGFITGFEDDVVWVEVDDDVQIRVSRGSLQGKVRTSGPAGGPAQAAGKVTPKDAAAGTATAKETSARKPTVKGVRADTASETAEADAADSTTKE
jgi:preprotein translocase subunit YajC